MTGSPNFYAAKSVTDGRGELGYRADKSFAMLNGAMTLGWRPAGVRVRNDDGISRNEMHHRLAGRSDVRTRVLERHLVLRR